MLKSFIVCMVIVLILTVFSCISFVFNSSFVNALEGEQIEGAYSGAVLIRRNNKNNTFASYVEEIIKTEGLFQLEFLELTNDELREEELSSYDFVLLSEMLLSKDEVDLLKDFVYEGGKLVALRPPKVLAEVFGFELAGIIDDNGFVEMIEAPWVWPVLAGQRVQFYGEADIYSTVGAEVVTWLDVDGKQSPGALINQHGDGEVAVFTFDVAKSVVRGRQGDPDYGSTGKYPDANRDGAYRADDLFFQQRERDMLDIPQADIVQRQLINVISRLVEKDVPLVTVWYYPHASEAGILLTGDSDGMALSHLEHIARGLSEYDAPYTTYLWEQDWNRIPPNIERLARTRDGFAFGVHGWIGPTPSVEQMEAALIQQHDVFESRYGYRPLSYRGHWLIWVGWTEMAQLLYDVGVRMDLSFVPVYRYGYLNGSGLLMKFINEKGEIIDIYQQGTQFEDDCVLFGYHGFRGITVEEAIEETFRFIDDAIHYHHGVITFNLHPIYIKSHTDTLPWLTSSAEYAQELGIPAFTPDFLIEFNDNRRGIEIYYTEVTSTSVETVVKFQEEIQGATLLFPKSWEGHLIKSVVVDGQVVSHDALSIYGGLEKLAIVLNGSPEKNNVIKVKYDN